MKEKNKIKFICTIFMLLEYALHHVALKPVTTGLQYSLNFEICFIFMRQKSCQSALIQSKKQYEIMHSLKGK